MPAGSRGRPGSRWPHCFAPAGTGPHPLTVCCQCPDALARPQPLGPLFAVPNVRCRRPAGCPHCPAAPPSPACEVFRSRWWHNGQRARRRAWRCRSHFFMPGFPDRMAGGGLEAPAVLAPADPGLSTARSAIGLGPRARPEAVRGLGTAIIADRPGDAFGPMVRWYRSHLITPSVWAALRPYPRAAMRSCPGRPGTRPAERPAAARSPRARSLPGLQEYCSDRYGPAGWRAGA
jgi:hypothetical protein